MLLSSFCVRMRRLLTCGRQGTCHVLRNTRCCSSAATSALVYQLDGGQLACEHAFSLTC